MSMRKFKGKSLLMCIYTSEHSKVTTEPYIKVLYSRDINLIGVYYAH